MIEFYSIGTAIERSTASRFLVDTHHTIWFILMVAIFSENINSNIISVISEPTETHLQS